MGRCETCGNEYVGAFEVVMDGERHVFDTFECAIHALAPTCANCGVRIVGHGIDTHGPEVYCCAHCARAEGVHGAVDHVRQDAREKAVHTAGPTDSGTDDAS